MKQPRIRSGRALQDFNTARNEADDSSGWPGDYDDPDLRKFFESTWESTQMANNPISATYRRDIPGYRFKSVLLKNNKVRKYGEASGHGTMTEEGKHQRFHQCGKGKYAQ